MNYFSYLYFLTSIILENIVVCSNLLQTGKGGGGNGNTLPKSLRHAMGIYRYRDMYYGKIKHLMAAE